MFILAILGVVAWCVVSIFAAMFFRTVVPTNAVHIVQSRRKTTAYGKDQAAGNVYYGWPAWMPRIGIRVIKLPVSVFDVSLNNYAAYDKGRVPFVVDILAFFRVENPAVAAQRVSSFDELHAQLEGILQGASRSILAQSPIEEILEERAKYGQMFTDATNNQLSAWGVVNVKNIELMDIRDAQNSKSIQNIMAMKQSAIERDSRVAVASNQQTAGIAEINASQAVAIKKQEAEEFVGVRTAQKEQQIGIAGQKAAQGVKEEERATAEKAMAVKQVNDVRAAEIAKGVRVVQAEQAKQVAITEAEGTLAQQKLLAQGVQAQGEAKGAAETAVLMAPVNAQLKLAEKIGENKGYQEYLVTIRQIEASQAIGIEQAKALEAADIKVIANAGNAVEGVKSAMELFTTKGGTQIGGMLEALKQTDTGKAVISALTNGTGEAHADR